MTAREVVRSLRRFALLGLGVFSLFLLIGMAAAILPEKRYKASALVFVQPKDTQSGNFGTATLDLLMPTIVTQVGTRLFYREVRQSTPRDLGDAALSATSEPGTGALTVVAESTDPVAAAAAANAAAAQLKFRPLSDTVTFKTLDPAVPPTEPSSPRKGAILLGCAVLGLIAALFACLAANRFWRRFSGADVIRRDFGLTVLGELPRTRHVGRHPSAVFNDDANVELAESFRRLGTNFNLLADDSRIVGITSWGQGEGKTTITTTLGWMLASLGRDVAIVDLDLRRPSVHTPFGLDLRGGVADIGERGSRLEAVAMRPKATDLPELKIVTAGACYEQPARVIESVFPAVAEMLDDRLILVDTPPLMAAETALIASMVDALVVVVDVRRRDPAELEALLQVIKMTKTRVLGVVLNQMRRESRRRQLGAYYANPQPRPAGAQPRAIRTPPAPAGRARTR